MNNDFNYTPPRPSNTPSSDETHQEPSPPPQVVTSHRKGGAARLFWKTLAILLLLALLAGGMYFYHVMKVNEVQRSKAELFMRIDRLELEAKTKDTTNDKQSGSATTTTSPQSNTAIITGSASSITTTSATVAAVRGDGNMTALWVESGTDPASLTTASQKITNEIGMGTAGTYAEYPVKLTGLKPGTRYFYRAAATVDGKTVYGGVSSFVTAK